MQSQQLLLSVLQTPKEDRTLQGTQRSGRGRCLGAVLGQAGSGILPGHRDGGSVQGRWRGAS